MSNSACATARRAPRIIFNSDGDIHFRGVRPSDMAGFYRGIDELAGTQWPSRGISPFTPS